MVLLPCGSFSCNSWKSLLSHLPNQERDRIWEAVLLAISAREGKGKGKLSHLAINAGIPLRNAAAAKDGLSYASQSTASLIEGESRKQNVAEEEDGEKDFNVLRSPSGLILLYGDFGPDLDSGRRTQPTQADFEEAFWVSVKQNGVTQVWAPRWCMFSRGNVREKARILDFGGGESTGNVYADGNIAVDLYAGIGYFVFSYVKMGMRRVIGWELNPWSVEGLRRGAVANGWKVKVVRHEDEEVIVGEEDIVVFLEDNCHAAKRMAKLNDAEIGKHVNCGLLPTSQGSWEMALGLMRGIGWLHLHENIAEHGVQERQKEVEDMFSWWLRKAGDVRKAKVEHVEFVKTFAPGVWHIVFDVFISMTSS